MNTNTTSPTPTLLLREHPKLESLFKDAESRHFTDEELATIAEVAPESQALLDTAKRVREIEKQVVTKVVKEVFSQYDYEAHHDYATSKCPRDVRYVVAYASMAMITQDPKWYDDKILLWLKTILQAFEFPDRKQQGGTTIFSDNDLETALSKLTQKNKSIYHCYYRLEQDFAQELGEIHAPHFCPYIHQALTVLTEE